MRRFGLQVVLGVASLGLLTLAPSSSVRGGEPAFALGLGAPASIVDEAGAVISYEATGTLTTTGLAESDKGAQGWSLGLTAAGGEIVAITTVGTDAAGLFKDGFEKTELTTAGDGACAGKAGAVSALVLSFSDPVTVPPTGTVSVVKATVEATVPEPITTPQGDPACQPLVSTVSFTDGCQGSGQPVDNKVTYGGITYLPTKGSTTTSICPKFELPILMRVGFPDATVVSEDATVRNFVLSVPPPGAADKLVTASVEIVSNLEDDPATTNPDGVQGWSMSVKTGECFNLAAATTAGTDVGTYFSGGFEKTEVVDPANPANAGQEGAVSAVVLSFTSPAVLPLASTSTILLLEGSIDASAITGPGVAAPACELLITTAAEPGLKGSGQPVKTATTVAGATRSPGVLGGSLVLEGAREARFLRGNANGDTKLNIADPIWILNELFYAGEPTVCQDAADANDDGDVDSSDVAYLLAYLFGADGAAGPAPPAPFSACGPDPTEDELVCAESQPGC